MFNFNLKKYIFLFYFLLIIGTSLLIYNYRSIENFFHLTKIKVFTHVYKHITQIIRIALKNKTVHNFIEYKESNSEPLLRCGMN